MHEIDEHSTLTEMGKSVNRCSFMTDEENNLLACARAGDATAFESLVMPHRAAMLRLTRRILRNREDAEDAVQTALLDALRHLDTFQGRSRFSSWLTRIALNAAFMRLRSTRRRSETSLDEILERNTNPRFEVVDGRANPEQECSVKEACALLVKALGRLGPLYKEVLQIFHLQQLPAKEAARILGVPVGTVKARLHRARARLTRNVQPILVRRRRQTMVKVECSRGFSSSNALGA
jgi:RNA polymerase sigma-70 factor, ECF subfamily